MIVTLLRRTRFYMDEPETGKYTDNDLLDLVIPPALQEVWNYVNAAADNPIVASFPLNVEKDVRDYLMPPSVQNIWGIVELDAQGRVIREISPRQREDFRGNGWSLEGNMIRFDPLPIVTKTYTVYFTPVHDQPMQAGLGVLELGATSGVLDRFRLAGTPGIGFKDKRVDGYVGAALRLLGTNVVETRVIDTYVPHDSILLVPIVTVRPAFSVSLATTNAAYEIIPLGSGAFVESVSLGAALKLAAVRSISSTRMRSLWDQYRMSRRTEAMRLSAMMGRRGKTMGKLTVDNPDLGLSTLYGNSSIAR